MRTGRPRCDVDPERVTAFRAEGLSWRAIAKQLGVGVGTVHRIAQRRAKSVPKVVSEPDPIAEAHARLKTDFISRLCGEGKMEPSGRYGPEVAYQNGRCVR